MRSYRTGCFFASIRAIARRTAARSSSLRSVGIKFPSTTAPAGSSHSPSVCHALNRNRTSRSRTSAATASNAACGLCLRSPLTAPSALGRVLPFTPSRVSSIASASPSAESAICAPSNAATR